ncbi:MAG: efflux RND transporter permease subunit [Melioribacteraceae bacterium]|nr:efflux RND transporter permease subunit [Melioribacteraceae bacterium]
MINADLLDLSDIARRTFKERVQTIAGVSEVWIWGDKRYSMRLWMDPVKLAAYQITPLDVRNALTRENIELPTGRIEGETTELTIRTLGRLNTVEDFNNLIIKENNGKLVKFSDIGMAELYPENERTLLKRDGIPMVGIVLVPQPGANQIEIVDEFYERIEQIKKDLPEDIELGIGFDVTDYIRKSISEVQQTVILAFVLVIMVIFFFLRDWRTTLIPIIVIPIALTGSFFIMYLADYSINVLTLLGLVLAIGIVVDDAIVVLENIYKKIELGMDPVQAGLKGVREIFFAVISTTLALAAVFLPIMFLEGLTGRLFREFGVVIAGSVIISSFVALTFTPMLSSKILKQRQKHNWFYTKTEPFFKSLEKNYRNLLNSFMSKRWAAFIVIGIAVVMIMFFGNILQTELAPLEDRGAMRVSSTAPEGTTFRAMDDYMTQVVDSVMEAVPELDALISVTSPGFGASSSVNSGFMRISLVDANERERSQSEIANQVSQIVSHFNDARTFVIQDQSIGTSRGGLPVQYVLQAPKLGQIERSYS